MLPGSLPGGLEGSLESAAANAAGSRASTATSTETTSPPEPPLQLLPVDAGMPPETQEVAAEAEARAAELPTVEQATLWSTVQGVRTVQRVLQFACPPQLLYSTFLCRVAICHVALP